MTPGTMAVTGTGRNGSPGRCVALAMSGGPGPLPCRVPVPRVPAEGVLEVGASSSVVLRPPGWPIAALSVGFPCLWPMAWSCRVAPASVVTPGLCGWTGGAVPSLYLCPSPLVGSPFLRQPGFCPLFGRQLPVTSSV